MRKPVVVSFAAILLSWTFFLIGCDLAEPRNAALQEQEKPSVTQTVLLPKSENTVSRFLSHPEGVLYPSVGQRPTKEIENENNRPNGAKYRSDCPVVTTLRTLMKARNGTERSDGIRLLRFTALPAFIPPPGVIVTLYSR